MTDTAEPCRQIGRVAGLPERGASAEAARLTPADAAARSAPPVRRLSAAGWATEREGGGVFTVYTHEVSGLAMRRLGWPDGPTAQAAALRGDAAGRPDPHRAWTWAGFELRRRAFFDGDERP